MNNVPFNKPPDFESSRLYMADALNDGRLSGRGPYTERCEKWFINKFPSISGALLTTSCTHALEVTALLLDLSENDEVIVPSYTFVSSALAYHLHGAKIRFCDIRKDTLNIDESLLEEAITEKTKAIVVVHYAGVACEMDKIMRLAATHNLVVIEDNAHGLLGTYKGRFLGTIGDFSTLSFHETKNVSCGEGGALFVNSEKLLRRAEIIIEKGTNRSQFINGNIDKYSWVDKGSSYVLSDLLAALLLGQLEGSEEIQSKRRDIWERYFKGLSEWAEGNNVSLPFVPQYCSQSYHMFYILLPEHIDRGEFIRHLSLQGIKSSFHYVPLHESKMGKEISVRDQCECPISVDVSRRIVRIPMFFDIAPDEQESVIDAIQKFSPHG